MYGINVFPKLERFEEKIKSSNYLEDISNNAYGLKILSTSINIIKKEYQEGFVFLFQKFLTMWHTREISGLTEVEREECNSIGNFYPEFVDDIEISLQIFNS